MERKVKNLLIGFFVGLVFMLLPEPVLFIPGSDLLEDLIQSVVKTIGLIAVIVLGIKLLLVSIKDLKGM